MQQKQLFVLGRNRLVARVILALKNHGHETRDADDCEPESVPTADDVYIAVDAGEWSAHALHLLRQEREGKTVVVDFGSVYVDELAKFAVGENRELYRGIEELKSSFPLIGASAAA